MLLSKRVLKDVGANAAILLWHLSSNMTEGSFICSGSKLQSVLRCGHTSLETNLNLLVEKGYIEIAKVITGHGHGYKHSVRRFSLKPFPSSRLMLEVDDEISNKLGYDCAVVYGFVKNIFQYTEELEVGVSYRQFDDLCGIGRKALDKAISILVANNLISVRTGHCIAHSCKGARYKVFSLVQEGTDVDFPD